jgi:hypothetical protein
MRALAASKASVVQKREKKVKKRSKERHSRQAKYRKEDYPQKP